MSDSSSEKRRPRIGVPWRTSAEERAGQRARYEDYLSALRHAGAEPVEISLRLPTDQLQHLAAALDAVLLPGSPADIEFSRYARERHSLTADPDVDRERVDNLLIDHVLASGKPMLAICFGIQSLNVYLSGTLVQDIPSELHSSIDHDREEDHTDARHPVHIEVGRLADLTGRSEARVNSSHHQSILCHGRGLRVAAQAPDGVVEAVEWTGGPGWVVGVQWHPERMQGERFSDALFRQLVVEAESAASRR